MSYITKKIWQTQYVFSWYHFSLNWSFNEYSQWKFHVRQEGLIFSGGSVGTKIGSGVTSAALTGLLSYAGYVSSASGLITQPQSAIDMIVSLYMYGPILVWIVLIIVLLAYNLDKIYPQIMKDLAKREAEGKL